MDKHWDQKTHKNIKQTMHASLKNKQNKGCWKMIYLYTHYPYSG